MEDCFRWSSCQADFYSSESSDADSGEEDTNFEENDSLGEVSENLGKEKYTKAELLDLLKENDGDILATVRTILQDLTSDSLQNLSSQVAS